MATPNPRPAPQAAPETARTRVRILYQALIWAGFAVGLLVFMWFLSPILLPFLVGAAVAYFLDPPVRWLAELGVGRAVSAVLTMLLLFGVVALGLWYLLPVAAAELAALSRELPNLFEQAKEALNDSLPEDIEDEESTVRQLLADAGQALRENAQSVLLGVLQGVGSLVSLVLFWVVMPVVAAYLLIDWPRVVRAVDDLLPREHAPTLRRLACEMDEAIAGFVRGEVMVCTILAAYYAILLTLTGLSYGLIIGLVAGLVSFVPYVGAFVGGTLAIGFALYQFWGDPWWIAAVVAVFALGQFLEGQILVPWLVGHSVNLHPVWLIFAVMAFGSLFGLAGALVAVPLAAALGVLVRFAVDRYRHSQLYQGSHVILRDGAD